MHHVGMPVDAPILKKHEESLNNIKLLPYCCTNHSTPLKPLAIKRKPKDDPFDAYTSEVDYTKIQNKITKYKKAVGIRRNELKACELTTKAENICKVTSMNDQLPLANEIIKHTDGNNNDECKDEGAVCILISTNSKPGNTPYSLPILDDVNVCNVHGNTNTVIDFASLPHINQNTARNIDKYFAAKNVLVPTRFEYVKKNAKLLDQHSGDETDSDKSDDDEQTESNIDSEGSAFSPKKSTKNIVKNSDTTFSKHIYSPRKKSPKSKSHSVSLSTNYVCDFPECYFSTTNNTQYKKHILAHTVKRLYHCDTCGLGFNQLWRYHRHVKAHYAQSLVSDATSKNKLPSTGVSTIEFPSTGASKNKEISSDTSKIEIPSTGVSKNEVPLDGALIYKSSPKKVPLILKKQNANSAVTILPVKCTLPATKYVDVNANVLYCSPDLDTKFVSSYCGGNEGHEDRVKSSYLIKFEEMLSDDEEDLF